MISIHEMIQSNPIVAAFIEHQVRQPQTFNPKIHEQDAVYLEELNQVNGRINRALARYYLNSQLTLDIIRQIIESHPASLRTRLSGWHQVSRFLSINSGYGHLTRFLVQEIPAHQIWVTDQDCQGVEFQKREFGVNGVERLTGEFDVIFYDYYCQQYRQGTLGKTEVEKEGGEVEIFVDEVRKLYEVLKHEGVIIFRGLPGGEKPHLSLVRTRLEKAIQEVTQNQASLYLIKNEFPVTQDGWYILTHHPIQENLVLSDEGKEISLGGYPDGQLLRGEITAHGHIELRGWVRDGNLGGEVAAIEVYLNGILRQTGFPNFEGNSMAGATLPLSPLPDSGSVASAIHRLNWSVTLQVDSVSPQDVLMVKVINSCKLERVIEICLLGSIVFLYPKPPSYLVQGISGNPSVDDFIGSLANVRFMVRKYLRMAGLDFNQFNQILDFGCGVGRFLFAFESELMPQQQLWGCDVFEDCAQWCQENIPFATVKHNDIVPPLPFETYQFDLVYAASVFTHLRLDLQHFWAWEVYRVLQPGGILMMTLLGPYFFPSIYEISSQGVTHHGEMCTVGDEGLFLYLDYEGQGENQGQKEIAASHTTAVCREIFSMFNIIQRVPQSPMAGGQDLYILQKPLNASIVAMPSTGEAENSGRLDHQIFPGQKGCRVSQTFNLQGQRLFRVYPQVAPAGSYQVECQIEILAQHPREVLKNHRCLFNHNRVFGKTHYGVIEVEIPEYWGEVVVELHAEILDRGNLAAEQVIEVSWNFANFA